MTVDKRKLKELSAGAMKVFAKASPPAFDEITGHRCAECDGVRHDFHGIPWWEAEGDLINANYDKLPLFTPKSCHYYFPAYLIRALEKYDRYDEVLEFLIYSLQPSKEPISKSFSEERKALFSAEQKDLIVSFLETVVNDPQMYGIHNETQRALSYWKT